MLPNEIGLSTGCFYRKSIFEVIEPIAESGFKVLEISASPSHLDYHNRRLVREAARAIVDNGLEARCYHAPFGLGIDISSPDADRLEASMAEVMHALDAAVLLNAQFFVLHPGPDIQSQGPSEEIHLRKATAVGSLARVAKTCHEQGLVLLLENMLPHQLFGRLADLLGFREALGQDVGVCFDTGHAHLAGDVSMVASELAPFIRMVHAHDNLKEDEHLLPGQGTIDWGRLLTVLHGSGFSGLISLELTGEHEEEPADFLAKAWEAREYLIGISACLV